MLDQLVTAAHLTLKSPPSYKTRSDTALLQRLEVDDVLWIHAPTVRSWATRMAASFAIDESEAYSSGLDVLHECLLSYLDKGPTFQTWLELHLRSRAQSLFLARKEQMEVEAFSRDQLVTDSLTMGDTLASDLPMQAEQDLEERFTAPEGWSVNTRSFSPALLELYQDLEQMEEKAGEREEFERQSAPWTLWFMAEPQPRLPRIKERKRAGAPVPWVFEDYVEDPNETCGYRTVHPWLEHGVCDLLGLPTPTQAAD